MMLDPLLGPALQMAEKPVIPARRRADVIAHNITRDMEELVKMAAGETDTRAGLQIDAVCQALGVCVISLTAYARGVLPRVGKAEPNANIIQGV